MKKKSFPIYVADFETTSEAQYEIEHETRVYLWEWKSLDGKTIKRGIDIDSFFSTILSETKDRSICYFHNLSFDGEFLLWFFMRRGYKYVEEEPTENRTMNTVITDEGTIFKIIVCEGSKIIEFRCSYRLFPMSIDKIGKMVGVKKLTEKHNYTELKNFKTVEEVPQIEWDYLENDVEIMRLLVVYLDSMKMLSISISSASYKNWQKDKWFLSKNEFVKPTDERILLDIDKSYRGGITMVNPLFAGVKVEKAVSYDVNSLYPSVMYDNSMPCGQGVYYENEKECPLPKKLYAVYVSEAHITKGFVPFIGSMGFSYSSYKYDETITDKWLYLWEAEYRLFQRMYYGDWTVDHVDGFREAKDVFKSYIDRWIQAKMHPSCEAERQFAKLCLNSLYGKFGENCHRMSKIPVGIEGDELKYESVDNTGVYYDRKVASYITSMARTKLMTAVYNNMNRFIYCDTDSMYLTGWEDGNGIEIDPIRLGCWKDEHHYNGFKALKAKCYVKTWIDEKGKLNMDSSVAGLPKDARSGLNFDTLKNGFEVKNAKKVKLRVRGGVIITTTDFRIHV